MAGEDLHWVESDAAVAGLAAEVLDPHRQHPVICLTSRSRERDPALDPQEVRQIVGPEVPIFALPTGDLTRILQELLPPMLHVFGGAARIWWPRVNGSSPPVDHPLIQDRYGVYGSQAMRQFRIAFQRGGPTGSSGSRDPRVTQLTGERDAAVALGRKFAAEVARLDGELDEAKRRAGEAGRLLRAERRSTRGTPRGEGRDPDDGLDPEGRLHVMVVREWAATGVSERVRHPVVTFTFGSEFLKSVEQVAEVPLERIARVCARVAAGTAHESDGLQVHPLRTGSGGSDPQRVRDDGAKAWRCAVKRGTPSAPRLHYWVLPSGGFEFAKVVRHDDYSL